MVETQLCKLRVTSDTIVGHAYSMFYFIEHMLEVIRAPMSTTVAAGAAVPREL